MGIESVGNIGKVEVALLTRFLRLMQNSANYWKGENIMVGYNAHSGYSWVSLENDPHIQLVTHGGAKDLLLYSSGYDGLEFIKDAKGIKSLDDIEDAIDEIYQIDNLREDDYDDEEKIEEIIKLAEKAGWEQI